jgi:ubiquinone/menaquinone biosynthesis C-methylase UbiE
MRSCGERKPYTIPLPVRLVEVLEASLAKSVLEVGCGYGRTCFFLHEKGFNVVGVDVDKAQIRSASEEAKARGLKKVDFLLNDARRLCFPDSCFTGITMLGVLTLVARSERPRIVSEVHRVLERDGYLFIEEFGRTWENPVYAKRYRDDLKVTGELGTITVKDETGRILLFGHHFRRSEILDLLKDFRMVDFREGTFTSYYHRNWVRGYTILAQKRTG